MLEWTVCACDLSSREAETGELLQVQDQPRLQHSRALCIKKQVLVSERKTNQTKGNRLQTVCLSKTRENTSGSPNGIKNE